MYKVKIPYEGLDKHVIASAATEKDISREVLELDIPEENLLAAVYPSEPTAIANIAEATRRALENPVAGPKFSDLIGPDKSLAIITDNQFRPTPSAKYLTPILEIVKKVGIKELGVAIGGMMVSHEVPMDENQIKAKLGPKNIETIKDLGGEIWQNEPRKPDANMLVGFTELGTPVWVNKKLSRFMVKFGLPLTQAHPWGYGGGDKLGLAMSSEETIEIVHNYSCPLSPRTHYGAYTGPMRKDINEIARIIGYDYALNTIMDTKCGIIDLTYGKLPESHIASIEKFNKIYAYDIPQLKYRKADIVICGTFAPTDHIFFHTGWGVNSADLVCRDGGTIIYCSPCPGYGPFPGFALMDLMKPYMPPTAKNYERLLRDIYNRKVAMWAGCIWVPMYEVMLRKHLTIVTRKENVKMGKDIGIDATDSIKEAFDEAMKRCGRDAKVLILPYARYQLPLSAVEM